MPGSLPTPRGAAARAYRSEAALALAVTVVRPAIPSLTSGAAAAGPVGALIGGALGTATGAVAGTANAVAGAVTPACGPGYTYYHGGCYSTPYYYYR